MRIGETFIAKEDTITGIGIRVVDYDGDFYRFLLQCPVCDDGYVIYQNGTDPGMVCAGFGGKSCRTRWVGAPTSVSLDVAQLRHGGPRSQVWNLPKSGGNYFVDMFDAEDWLCFWTGLEGLTLDIENTP